MPNLKEGDRLKRMFFNQPSTLQPHHDLHGVCVLAVVDSNDEVDRVYFLRGAVISQEVAPNTLSPGWPDLGLGETR